MLSALTVVGSWSGVVQLVALMALALLQGRTSQQVRQAKAPAEAAAKDSRRAAEQTTPNGEVKLASLVEAQGETLGRVVELLDDHLLDGHGGRRPLQVEPRGPKKSRRAHY